MRWPASPPPERKSGAGALRDANGRGERWSMRSILPKRFRDLCRLNPTSAPRYNEAWMSPDNDNNDMESSRRNVFLLSCCQALLLTNAVTLIAVSSLVGYAIAANKSLATLPATLYTIGVAITA